MSLADSVTLPHWPGQELPGPLDIFPAPCFPIMSLQRRKDRSIAPLSEILELQAQAGIARAG